jgi:Macrocin-O-methyltransferase (TylF)
MNQYKEMYIELLKKCLTASCYDESSWVKVDLRGKGSLAKPLSYARGVARGWIMDFLDRKKLQLFSPVPFDPVARNEGRDWPFFGFSMAGHKRLDNIRLCIEDVLENKVPGDFVETGVWRGGMVIFMAALLKMEGVTDRKIWAADSFEGLPAPNSDQDKDDYSEVEQLKVSLEQVKANFARFDLLSDQIQFLKGWFCDTLPTAPIDKIAILRLDGDMYVSTMDALRALYHKVSLGGYVIIDDYYGWEACRAAVSDFLKEHRLDPEIKTIDYSAVYWKVLEPLTLSNAAVASEVAAGASSH